MYNFEPYNVFLAIATNIPVWLLLCSRVTHMKQKLFWFLKTTWGTPILRQASRKFSTFRRHLAIVSLGWKERKHETDAMLCTDTETQANPESLSPLPVRGHGCSVWTGDAHGWPDGTTRPRQSKLPRDQWVRTPWVGTRCSTGLQNETYSRTKSFVKKNIIYTTSQKFWIVYYFIFFKEHSSAHHACIFIWAKIQ